MKSNSTMHPYRVKISRATSRGFTLLEAIVYVSLFVIVLFTLTAFLLDLIHIRNQTKAERVTYQEARYLLERINQRIRYAPGIDMGNSLFENEEGKLVLKSPVAATNLTVLQLQSGAITEKVGEQSPAILSSEDVIVTVLRFNLLIASETESTIETTVTLSYNDRGRSDLKAHTSLTTQASLRNDYAYTWTQTDWSAGSGQTLWDNPAKYSSNPDSGADAIGCPGSVRLGTTSEEIVLHVADVCAFHGNYHLQDDPLAADFVRGEDTPNLGLRVGGHFGNAAESSPTHYFDLAFKALPNTTYHAWARLRVAAENDYGTSDSLYLQFSDALLDGDPVNRIGSSQGLIVSISEPVFAWNDRWTGIVNNVGERMTFEQGGDHVVRVQRREDGFAIDQIVLSKTRYLNSGPAADAILSRDYVASTELLSSKFDTGNDSVFGQLFFASTLPAGTSIKFQMRTGPTPEGLDGQSFLGPTGLGTFYTEPSVGVNSFHDGDRWVQYRAILETTDPTQTPVFGSFSLSYSN